jgi:hypothetical protein
MSQLRRSASFILPRPDRANQRADWLSNCRSPTSRHLGDPTRETFVSLAISAPLLVIVAYHPHEPIERPVNA